MTLNDFVMLGKTVPEPNSDGRVFVCSAGYSLELRSLLRVYPLARRNAPPRWSVSRVELCRNPKDSRSESWKINGDRSPETHDAINSLFEPKGTVTEKERRRLLSGCLMGSINEANAKRRSLAILEPEGISLTFEHNPESPASPQLRLFEWEPKPTLGSKRFAYIPRLRFRDEEGWHCLMLRDWGCYEFLRKQGDGRRHELAAALGLSDACSLLIGNLNHHRTAWLVISVLRGLRGEQPQLTLDLVFDPKEKR